MDSSKVALEDAKLEGTIDKGYYPEQTTEMLAQCDIIYVCLYPDATLKFLEQYETVFKSGAIITDIAGVKNHLISTLKWSRNDVVFVPGHPMAGSEREGFTHASSEIFKGRNYIFMDPIIGNSESSSSECQIALSTIKEIAIAIGFTRLIDTTPEIHDHKIAFTSQL